ncbi:MAG: hypothetical protein AAGK09_09600 [Planctomycetota bacterium]
MAHSTAQPARADRIDRTVVLAAAAALALAVLACVGCAAEREPVTAVAPSYSHVRDGRAINPAAPAPATMAQRFLRPAIDRPAESLNATAAADRFE